MKAPKKTKAPEEKTNRNKPGENAGPNTDRAFLVKEPALRQTLKKMQDDPDYKPAWAGDGPDAIDKVRKALSDVRAATGDVKSEGDG